jgi:hypothetical protein
MKSQANTHAFVLNAEDAAALFAAATRHVADAAEAAAPGLWARAKSAASSAVGYIKPIMDRAKSREALEAAWAAANAHSDAAVVEAMDAGIDAAHAAADDTPSWGVAAKYAGGLAAGVIWFWAVRAAVLALCGGMIPVASIFGWVIVNYGFFRALSPISSVARFYAAAFEFTATPLVAAAAWLRYVVRGE